ncbi:Ltp family lipoprotein [Streptococcus mitis]|uniref:Ltp family lipoprotein n=1 Tax=Streptococcus mitis TaxID=28037 RepID=UPI0031F310EB
MNADYKSNALAKAKSYRKLLKNSKSAIYNQLVSPYGEEFTEEANYAIQHLDD